MQHPKWKRRGKNARNICRLNSGNAIFSGILETFEGPGVASFDKKRVKNGKNR
jgi:hypothetical protein